MATLFNGVKHLFRSTDAGASSEQQAVNQSTLDTSGPSGSTGGPDTPAGAPQDSSVPVTGVSEYAHPDVLVDTWWVAQHVDDANVRMVEADEDPLLYEAVGHIRNAVKLDWHTDVQDPVRRDFVNKADFEALLRRYGIANDTTVVFYGDRNNWYAAYSYWLFRLYGHPSLRIMNGGRTKWEAEGREYTKDVPQFPASQYVAQDADLSIRAFRRQVEDVLQHGRAALVDVRSNDEYTGSPGHCLLPHRRALGAHVVCADSVARLS